MAKTTLWAAGTFFFCMILCNGAVVFVNHQQSTATVQMLLIPIAYGALFGLYPLLFERFATEPVAKGLRLVLFVLVCATSFGVGELTLFVNPRRPLFIGCSVAWILVATFFWFRALRACSEGRR